MALQPTPEVLSLMRRRETRTNTLLSSEPVMQGISC